MHLWTEYEGNTLAGYPLGRLTRSEGRNAFFATQTPEGKPATLRLTEAHFDEGELTTRWRLAAAVHHPNLQPILHFGQTTYDSVPLACCLLEQPDASLSDVLRERALSVDETKEVAEAVARAVAALHEANLIHEHIDATNVYAVGTTVKLRSDCVRECHGDFEADTAEAREELRWRDIRDLGLLLLRCLKLDWQGTTTGRLPAPFDRIVPNALDGTWTAQAIVAAIEATRPAPISVSAPAETPAVAAKAAPAAKVSPAAKAIPAVPRFSGLPPAVAKTKPASSDPFDTCLGRLRNEPIHGQTPQQRIHAAIAVIRPSSKTRNAWIGTAAAALLLAAIVWNTTGSKSSPSAAHASTVVAEPVQAVHTAAAQPVAPPPPASQLEQHQSLLSHFGNPSGWHVIAYTYNKEQQAQAKAESLQARYLNLHPQVFTPTGHAPYFVALGDATDQNAAQMLRDQARRAGLPRDTYIRAF